VTEPKVNDASLRGERIDSGTLRVSKAKARCTNHIGRNTIGNPHLNDGLLALHRSTLRILDMMPFRAVSGSNLDSCMSMLRSVTEVRGFLGTYRHPGSLVIDST